MTLSPVEEGTSNAIATPQPEHGSSSATPQPEHGSSSGPNVPGQNGGHRRTNSNLSGSLRQSSESFTTHIAARLRSASIKFEESSPPRGAWDTAASLASSMPSRSDMDRGGAADGGRSQTLASLSDLDASSGVKVPQRAFQTQPLDAVLAKTATKSTITNVQESSAKSSNSKSSSENDKSNASPRSKAAPFSPTEPFPNGYQFPPQHSWQQATTLGLQAFWSFACTWFGFLVVIYGLLVVAWGGMIFLLLCNAAPAMCHPTCNDINSPRRIWIEIDSQVLTALFCVTGFGLIPWRFRDLWYLCKYRIGKDEMCLRRLAGIHRGWFRLPGSQDLAPDIGPQDIATQPLNISPSVLPHPPEAMPDPPLTGIRAPATAWWKLDFVIWMYVWNTFLQAVLSGLMWGLNRYDRPSWSTGVFVALACIVAAAGGIMVFVEGKRVKGIEGIPVSDADLVRLRNDREAGKIHYNNIKGKLPKAPIGNQEAKKGPHEDLPKPIKRSTTLFSLRTRERASSSIRLSATGGGRMVARETAEPQDS